jgi:hypothetical protein
VNAPALPKWTVFGGAAYACVAATGVPGLAALLRAVDAQGADRVAFIAELPLALAAFGLGYLQTRAALTGGGLFRAILRVLVFAGVVVVIGAGVTIGNATGTTEGGGILAIGLMLSIAAAFVQSALALFNGWEIGLSVRLMPQGELAVRSRMSGLLAWASVSHIALKLVAGGSVLFGALGAICAAGLARSVGATRRVAFMSVTAVLGLGLQARGWSETVAHESLTALPFCATQENTAHEADVLARRVRALPGVADAATDTEGDRVIVYVLPLGGGPLDDATKKAAEQAIAGAQCSIWDGHDTVRGTRFEVQGTKPVTLDVTAKFHANKAVAPDSDKQIDAAVRAHFDVTKKDLSQVRVPGRQSFSEVWTGGLLGWVEYSVGPDALSTRLTALKPGSIVVVGKVDVTVIPPDADH